MTSASIHTLPGWLGWFNFYCTVDITINKYGSMSDDRLRQKSGCNNRGGRFWCACKCILHLTADHGYDCSPHCQTTNSSRYKRHTDKRQRVCVCAPTQNATRNKTFTSTNSLINQNRFPPRSAAVLLLERKRITHKVWLTIRSIPWRVGDTVEGFSGCPW